MGSTALLFSFSLLVAVSWAVPQEPAAITPTKNATEESPGAAAEQPPPGDRFNEFDWRLCQALAATEKGNIVISPISLKLVLAMVFEGASGKTADELAAALDLIKENTGRQLSRKKFSKIIENLKSSEGEYDLNLGTSIFIDKSVTPKPTYVRKLQSFYEAQIEQVDFSQTKDAVKAINAWASGATKGHIQNLLSNTDTSANTVLMLLNAIYFKGTWKYTFPLNLTVPGTFYADGNTPVTVKYMNSAYYHLYLDAPEIKSQIVRLPYVGKKFAMYIIVPYNRTGLRELVHKINPFVLRKHSQNMYETLVELSLPSFKIEYTANLRSVLQQLGMKKLFGDDAELNEIAEVLNNSIAVSNVLQKAGIQVNEEGSTAYAATEGQVVNKFGDSPVVKLNVDRPFLFFIKDEETDTVLFVGNMVNPEDKTATVQPVTHENNVTEHKTQPVVPKPENQTIPLAKPANTTCDPMKNGSIPGLPKCVQLYFSKEVACEDTIELITSQYLTGTTSYKLGEAIEFYFITINADLERIIQFYFSAGYSADDLEILIRFYFLMEIKTDELKNFLDVYFVKGNASEDIDVLRKYFSIKGVTPVVIEQLIEYYQNDNDQLLMV